MIGINRPIKVCHHNYVSPTKHPAVWICVSCKEEFVPKYFWDAEYIKHNDILKEIQKWEELGHVYGIGGKRFYNKVRALLKQEQKMKVYIAGGWFSPKQEECVRQIEDTLSTSTLFDVYSPRKEMLYTPGADMNPKDVLDSNIIGLERANVVVASTEGKDMGTLFECGYAYSIGIPIVYYFKHHGKFNLMLSGSAKAVLTSLLQLQSYFALVSETGKLQDKEWKGQIE